MRRLQLEGQSGKNSFVYFEKVGQKLWLHWMGKTYSFDIEKRRRSSANADITHGDSIVAPMPGKILKVHVKQGQSVNADQTLVVMEAMKMEYSLKAGRKGLIEKICYGEGEQVNAGSILVVLEDIGES